MTHHPLLLRIGLPREGSSVFWSGGNPADLGGGAAWNWGYAGVLHALAAPEGFAAVPAVPRSGCRHEESLGYWAPLHQLLLYRLGWSDPGRGLMWWYDAGKPVDDPVLALVKQVWDQDDCLDPYLAWLLRSGGGFRGSSRGADGSTDDRVLGDAWTWWLRSVERRWTADRWPWFSPGAGDPLHLHSSATQQGPVDDAAALVAVDRDSRRATLITGRADSWYRTLERLGNDLPPVSMSWRIDVHDRALGHLGTYRRSLVTGLWFSTRHRIHARGNPSGLVASLAPPLL